MTIKCLIECCRIYKFVVCCCLSSSHASCSLCLQPYSGTIPSPLMATPLAEISSGGFRSDCTIKLGSIFDELAYDWRKEASIHATGLMGK